MDATSPQHSWRPRAAAYNWPPASPLAYNASAVQASSFASDAEKTSFGWRSTASTASQAFACDAFSRSASTVSMSAVASLNKARFVATDALLARRASSFPAASQVFIAA